ncbi:S41 family peptidase [Pedobacter montanisoli]|uniref:S41 family peptidase n=1 Tax=Pedobacter montanisoli TaxID=2923277 RepID=A0ABS9ZSN0_9SPHI|nr:S41 family peptidase [Pedobacter montanisoli]MCJ0741343.1 S41 family peptidase [Pedobacter montanisoli]
MKKWILILAGILSFNILFAQNSNEADIDALYHAITQTKSYKDQLKNNKAYHQLYSELKSSLTDTNEFEVFKQLCRLIIPLKDNHLGFYRTPGSAHKWPAIKAQFDSENLKKIHPDSLEGIYDVQGAGFAIYKNANEYHIANVKTGLLSGYIFKTPHSSFDAILFSNGQVPYILIRNVKLVDGDLIGTPFRKFTTTNHALLSNVKESYEFKLLNEQTAYLRLSSFASNPKNIEKATAFYQQIADSLKYLFLIVDLRNNGGGGYKTSQQFISLLKKYKGKIYILQNAYTVSNAEQFILKVRKLKNVTTLGTETRGQITYGSNYGNNVTLPSKRFTFYPTDMNGIKEELAVEDIGIKPDVKLNATTADWIAQTLDYIKKHHE